MKQNALPYECIALEPRLANHVMQAIYKATTEHAETDPQDREETRKTKPEKLMVYPTCLSLPIKQLIYKQLAGCFG